MTGSINTFVALDVETTGLSPFLDEIIELAAIKFKDGKIVDEFVTLIHPSRQIPARITQITGITNSMVASAPRMDEIISKFLKFCAGELIVAHNASFDMGFINAACDKYGLTFDNKVVCTLQLSRKKLNLPNNKLATVSRHFSLEDSGFHRAKADATICGEIFLYLADEGKMQDISDEIMPEAEREQPLVDDNPLTVTQLNHYIKNLIENDVNLFSVSVCAEVSNFKKHYSGHLYLSLKDDTSVIRAVMFKHVAGQLKFQPEDGMKVVVTGKVSVYEATGQYQIYIDSMTPYGAGDLHVAFEQLKKKLSEAGFFDDSRKRAICKFPLKIGVVTSPTGAVIQDIINVITRRFPICEILLYPAKVQGDGAVEQIVEGIEYFNSRTDIDTMIVGRGGGSIEDLWAFNEEKVAMAIVNSKIPIISAVGHETDFTIADFVADLRAPTPSAAAEVATMSNIEIRAALKNYYGKMLFALKQTIENRRQLLKRFSVKSPLDAINTHRLRLDSYIEKIGFSAENILTGKRNALAVCVGRLNALSPLKVISRGYSVTQNGLGKAIRSVEDVDKGEKIVTRLEDGIISSIVEEVVIHE
ncbi:MAG: exodeoxyribonuclease VII large subunit [Clostridiales bacterium]|jgi:exodeoxyribonuclease VII large subunit|nr:exodeoxyribonuclease VII large subunit [Clostridiales bacterium]